MKGLCIVAIFLNVSAVFCSSKDNCTSSSDFGGPLILTPYIESNNISEARELSNVTVLGWTGYSGFFTVNKQCGGNLFFWFIPARNNCTKAPMFLWLNGGPGSTSMEGMFQEHGPYECKNAASCPTLRDEPWTDDVNMLYVDQPIGTGFSFPKNSCLAENVTVSTEQLYSLLVQFFKMFPEYQDNRFYLTGQSFGGHYIPCLGAFIDEMNARPDVETVMNLQGIMVGNPFIRMDCHNYADYVYELSFVSDEKRREIDSRHREIASLISQGLLVEATDKWIEVLNYIVSLTDLPSIYFVGPFFDETAYYLSWLDTAEARCKLHVGNETFVEFNNDIYNTFKPDMARSFAGYVEVLLRAKNYTVWFYSGNLDMSCLSASTDCALLGLDWPGADGYRAADRTAWFHGGELAGHVQRYDALALVTVKDAGHGVPAYQPKPMYDIVRCLVYPCDKDEPFCRLNFTAP